MKRSLTKLLGVVLMLAGILAGIYFTGRWQRTGEPAPYGEFYLVASLGGLGCFLAGTKMYCERCLWNR